MTTTVLGALDVLSDAASVYSLSQAYSLQVQDHLLTKETQLIDCIRDLEQHLIALDSDLIASTKV